MVGVSTIARSVWSGVLVLRRYVLMALALVFSLVRLIFGALAYVSRGLWLIVSYPLIRLGAGIAWFIGFSLKLTSSALRSLGRGSAASVRLIAMSVRALLRQVEKASSQVSTRLWSIASASAIYLWRKLSTALQQVGAAVFTLLSYIWHGMSTALGYLWSGAATIARPVWSGVLALGRYLLMGLALVFSLIWLILLTLSGFTRKGGSKAGSSSGIVLRFLWLAFSPVVRAGSAAAGALVRSLFHLAEAALASVRKVVGVALLVLVKGPLKALAWLGHGSWYAVSVPLKYLGKGLGRVSGYVWGGGSRFWSALNLGLAAAGAPVAKLFSSIFRKQVRGPDLWGRYAHAASPPLGSLLAAATEAARQYRLVLSNSLRQLGTGLTFGALNLPLAAGVLVLSPLLL